MTHSRRVSEGDAGASFISSIATFLPVPIVVDLQFAAPAGPTPTLGGGGGGDEPSASVRWKASRRPGVLQTARPIAGTRRLAYAEAYREGRGN